MLSGFVCATCTDAIPDSSECTQDPGITGPPVPRRPRLSQAAPLPALPVVTMNHRPVDTVQRLPPALPTVQEVDVEAALPVSPPISQPRSLRSSVCKVSSLCRLPSLAWDSAACLNRPLSGLVVVSSLSTDSLEGRSTLGGQLLLPGLGRFDRLLATARSLRFPPCSGTRMATDGASLESCTCLRPGHDLNAPHRATRNPSSTSLGGTASHTKAMSDFTAQVDADYLACRARRRGTV